MDMFFHHLGIFQLGFTVRNPCSVFLLPPPPPTFPKASPTVARGAQSRAHAVLGQRERGTAEPRAATLIFHKGEINFVFA